MERPPGDISVYEEIGGTSALRRLAETFYSRVDRDPILRPLFPGKSLHCAIEELTAFLVQFLGGPAIDSQRRWWLSLRESHLRFKLRQEERTAWMQNMIAALNDVQMEEPLRGALREFFEHASAYLVNTSPQPAHRDANCLHQEIGWRWKVQQSLDQAIEFLRKGDAVRALDLAERDPLLQRLQRDPSLQAAFLGAIMSSGDPLLTQYVHRKLTESPGLRRERYAGRTLLHDACGQSNRAMVELLLRFSADPNVTDDGGHTPLYWLANRRTVAEGAGIVRALMRRGANLNAADGVKRTTALHMAARQGNVDVATALLDCAAAIDPRDSLGDTPLRRAVNCGRADVALLLISRGADPRSLGSKGLTPQLAARNAVMKQILYGR